MHALSVWSPSLTQQQQQRLQNCSIQFRTGSKNLEVFINSAGRYASNTVYRRYPSNTV